MLEKHGIGPSGAPASSRMLIATAIGVVAATADLFWGHFLLLGAPQLVALVIGVPLPSRTFGQLFWLLGLTIAIPGLVHGLDTNLLQRLFALAFLAVAAHQILGQRKASGSDVASSKPVFNDDPTVDLTGEAAVAIRLPANDDSSNLLLSTQDDSAVDIHLAETRDIERHQVDIIGQIQQEGSFSDQQVTFVESLLNRMDESEVEFEGVYSIVPGDQIGQYVIDELLGRGGAGSIFRGHDCESNAPVAIKILHNAKMSERFRREMLMVQELAHPNIVTAYEVTDFHGLPFIAMELLPGPDLNEYIQINGPMSWQSSAQYILQIARALEHAHSRDLIHRDIKPGNIMFSDKDHVKLVDLGLAVMSISDPEDHDADGSSPGNPNSTNRAVLSQQEKKDVNIAGTLPYMAPEQASSLGSANIQSDIFGLGATWFYLLTGETRLIGQSLNEQYVNLISRRKFRSLSYDQVPRSFYKIFEKMTAYDATDRYASCYGLVLELEQALTREGEAVSHDDVHVLVVEDSRADMLRTITVLGQTNRSLEIHQATTLAEGIQMYRELEIDLVLLDLTLPDSEDTQTVIEFREVAVDAPIVVLSGVSGDDISQKCLEAGATRFVSKEELDAHSMERAIFVTLSRHRVGH